MADAGLSDRKLSILQAAIDIIVNDGYGGLGMRSLARASGLKLGALQYHFPTWESLLDALVTYIYSEYRAAWDALDGGDTEADLRDHVRFLLEDAPGVALASDRLWPQLWAMSQVEPSLKKMVDEVYAFYLKKIESAFKAQGSEQPRLKALAIMSMIEGSTLFIGEERQWAKHANAFNDLILKYADELA